jgi:hypothetical protein
MSFAETVPAALPARESSLPFKLAIAFVLAALADWLFYDQSIGISAVIFALALACGAAVANMAGLDRKQIWLVVLVLLAGLVPAIEEANALSLALIVLALGLALTRATNPDLDGPERLALAFRDLFVIGPLRFFRDTAGMVSLPGIASGLTVWFVPLALGGFFIVLFATANPIIESWIRELIPGNTASHVSFERILFWIAAISLVWPFVHVWWQARPEVGASSAEPVVEDQATASEFFELLGAAAILRSLLLFNLVFAVQSALDLVYLWGNAELPAGITYAAYAHRGAYALILTALLAAGFVLAAMRPGGPAREVKVIRPLVYLFVAQNILLVASSILRLDLYVQIYLLTYWRVAAFIWMLMVALGLVLIVARIALERPNSWLIHANLIVLTAVLYASSLTNFAAIIANYNVSHSREAAGKGVTIDMNYLLQLGPQALPAIDKALQLRAPDPFLVARRDRLADEQTRRMASWRAWDFRSWRLQRYMNIPRDGSTAGS